MENTVPNTMYNGSDLLLNSCYDSYSDLLFNTHQNFLYNFSNPTFELYGSLPDSPDPIFELYDSSHDSSDLFFDETQIENEMIDDVIFPEDENIFRYDGNVDHDQEKEYDSEHEEKEKEYDDSEYDDEENEIKLHQGMEFETWELAESYLDKYAKQQGFCYRKRRRVPDPIDNTITRRRTYECSHAQTHEAQKVILAENRRDRDSEMIGCPWHINVAFSKSANNVRINSIVGEHNHDMNPLITETAPKFRKLTDKMLEKVKFWTIQGKMGISTQYNLLVASFPDAVINKKNLSNAIQ